MLYGLPPWAASPVAYAGAELGIWGQIQELYCRLGCPRKILSGPFRGMSWEPADAGGAWLAKIIGTYELELHPSITNLERGSFEVLVDLGCADGYYAVGLAKLLDIPKVRAFDTDFHALECLKGNIRKNSLETQFQINNFCSPDHLDSALDVDGKRLVLCDIEGAEMQVLDPQACPRLRLADILVEVHDFPPPGIIGKTLRDRFASSHLISSIQTVPRCPQDLPQEALALIHEWELAINEDRTAAMEWLWLKPR